MYDVELRAQTKHTTAWAAPAPTVKGAKGRNDGEVLSVEVFCQSCLRNPLSSWGLLTKCIKNSWTIRKLLLAKNGHVFSWWDKKLVLFFTIPISLHSSQFLLVNSSWSILEDYWASTSAFCGIVCAKDRTSAEEPLLCFPHYNSLLGAVASGGFEWAGWSYLWTHHGFFFVFYFL